ncbi:hypothetical protein [Antarcticibacterium arcticum]|nr:hypothetical protein [Antarcticibacterium arcticum]
MYTRFLEIFPTLGILIFGALYAYSSTLYPGGSQANINSEGFDWVHNYWCDLMNENGMNLEPNPASPVAVSAMMILCISLMSLFIRFAGNFANHPVWKKVIMICGTISMICAILVFTRYHSVMIAVSSLFGLFTLVGIIFEVYNSNLKALKFGGLFCILLLAVNNYIYYSREWVEILPLLQKITFALVLLWLIGINYSLKLKRKNPESSLSESRI